MLGSLCSPGAREQETSSLVIASWCEQTPNKKIGHLSFRTQKDSVLLMTAHLPGRAGILPTSLESQTRHSCPHGRSGLWHPSSVIHPQRRKSYSGQCVIPGARPIPHLFLVSPNQRLWMSQYHHAGGPFTSLKAAEWRESFSAVSPQNKYSIWEPFYKLRIWYKLFMEILPLFSLWILFLHGSLLECTKQHKPHIGFGPG